jgi:hypothetical protein
MSAVDIVVAVAGCGVSALVVIAMILITPRGLVDLREEAKNSSRTDVPRVEVSERLERVHTSR